MKITDVATLKDQVYKIGDTNKESIEQVALQFVFSSLSEIEAHEDWGVFDMNDPAHSMISECLTINYGCGIFVEGVVVVKTNRYNVYRLVRFLANKDSLSVVFTDITPELN